MRRRHFALLCSLRGAFSLLVLVSLLSACSSVPWIPDHTTTGAVDAATGIDATAIALFVAPEPPEITDDGKQWTHKQGATAGLIAGGGAGAGFGATTCAPTIFGAVIYGTCITMFSVVGMGVGAVGGLAAVESYYSESASQMLPDLRTLPQRFSVLLGEALNKQLGEPPRNLAGLLPASAGGHSDSGDIASSDTESIGKTRALDEAAYVRLEQNAIDKVLEAELTAVRALALRWDNYRIQIKASSRLHDVHTRTMSETQSYQHKSSTIDGDGDLEHDTAEISEVADAGLSELAYRIVSHHFGRQ